MVWDLRSDGGSSIWELEFNIADLQEGLVDLEWAGTVNTVAGQLWWASSWVEALWQKLGNHLAHVIIDAAADIDTSGQVALKTKIFQVVIKLLT